jgi:MFS family permease
VADVRATVSALRVAAGNDDIRRAELAWGASIAAEWGHFVALGVFAYERGGAAGVGLAGLIRLLPAALVAPAAATIGDRFRRERFLLALSLLAMLAFAGSAAAATAGSAALVYAFAAVVGVATTLIRPTLQALLPSLARTPSELISANAATSTIESAGTLVGPLVAGVLVATVSVEAMFWVCAAAVAVGALLLARVRSQVRMAAHATRAGRTLAGLGAGFSTVARPGTRVVTSLMVTQAFVRGCLNVLIVVEAFRVLEGGAGEVGYLTAAVGFGGLLGALWAVTLSERRLAAGFALALVFWGVPIALLASHPKFAVAFALLAVVGAANSVEDVAGFTLLQRTIPDAVLARALGVVWGVAMGALALGSLVAPRLVDALSARSAFLLVGAILPVVTLASYWRLSALDRLAPPSDTYDLVDGVPMLAPLSIAVKEQLASRLTPVSVAAREQIIRAGERGDRFYILASGTLEVDNGGGRSVLRAPDSFGEIALLRDVPRTATVTAATDSNLYALVRDDFLAAVTGHRVAHAAGQAVVDARLANTSA